MKHYIGIDLGGTEIKVGLINDHGVLLRKDSFKTEATLDGPAIVEYMATCARTVVERAKLTMKDVSGAGIGSPGLVNPTTGQVRNVVNIPALNDVYLSPVLTKHLGVPTFLDNDVNAMALGEMYYGAAKGFKDVICLTLGTGVGGGLIFDGKLYRGACFTAGEIGHLSIDPDGLHCPCGNYGCLERYIGRDGIITRFKTYKQKSIPTSIDSYLDEGEITPKAISMAATAKDALSIEVLEETGKLLGIALASLTNVLNPQVFVIGGGIANAGELILGPARKELRKRAYTIPAEKVQIVPAKLGNDAGIVGSASLAVQS